jgi:hypothetical protein
MLRKSCQTKSKKATKIRKVFVIHPTFTTLVYTFLQKKSRIKLNIFIFF